MRLKYLTPFVLTGFVLIVSSIAVADDDSDQDEVLRLRLEGKIVSLETILTKVKQIQTGKILEAELEDEHGRYIYEIEILAQDGVVWELKYDAKTATLLSTEKED